MRAEAKASIPEGVLVRVAVLGDRWAEELPPVPSGFDVSVSFTTEEAADLHAAALRLLGYRVVVVVPDDPPGEPTADFLVSRALLEARPRWAEALRRRAVAVLDLRFGPVALAMGGVLRAHRPHRARRPRRAK